MGNIFDIFRKLEAGDSTGRAAASLPLTHLVVGLGSTRCGVVPDRARFQALVGEAVLSGVRCLLMKPQTLMNASGLAVAAAARFYHVEPAHIIVISDDINLPVGGMRIRGKGSDGGQKGIRSIIQELGTDTFPRIRIGVGAKPHPDYDLAAWVLSDFTPAEMDTLQSLFPLACDGLEHLLHDDLDGAMRICNLKGEGTTGGTF